MSEIPIDSGFRIVGTMSEERIFISRDGRIQRGAFDGAEGIPARWHLCFWGLYLEGSK